MLRPIHISLSPNLAFDDLFLALRTLFFGTDDKAEVRLTTWFKNYLGDGFGVFTFNSGRSAQWAILKALGIGIGDEVLIQAFTCVAVPNSIKWLGATQIYVDIKKGTFNMNPVELEKKITKRSKAVIVQHTFGLSADLDQILKICQKYKLKLIEDCAHCLGATYKGKRLGSFGDAAFFSFGRDKIVSSVFGGVSVTSDKKLIEKISQVRNDLPKNSKLWIKQQLLHPVVTAISLALYNSFEIGKLILFLAQKTHFISQAVYPVEKVGAQPKFFPAKYCDELALLTLKQLEKLDKFNNHRREVAKLYFSNLKKTCLKLPINDEEAVYLRFPVLSPNASKLYDKAKEEGWVLGNWYTDIISPIKNLHVLDYKMGSCPVAERVAKEVLNLPTYPTLPVSQANQLIQKLVLWSK